MNNSTAAEIQIRLATEQAQQYSTDPQSRLAFHVGLLTRELRDMACKADSDLSMNALIRRVSRNCDAETAYELIDAISAGLSIEYDERDPDNLPAVKDALEVAYDCVGYLADEVEPVAVKPDECTLAKWAQAAREVA